MRASTLRIVVGPDDGLVDLVVDGRSLDDRGDRVRATARELLGAGALVPTVTPRRIALYGCECGEFGCSNITAVVERNGWTVRWRDFVSVTGWATGALPDVPDPAVEEDFVHPLGIPDLVFAGDEYDAVLAEATERAAPG